MSPARGYDVIVIGGGPAGCAAATVLAQRGRGVLLLERTKFPRYHIGESLIPYCYFTLARLGVIERMKVSRFTKKYSVRFVGENGKVSHPFYFFEHFQHEAATTWQVVRSEFDHMLLNNAREQGVEVREQTAVNWLVQADGATVGVRTVNANREVREFCAPLTIDASGFGGVAMKQFGWRRKEPGLRKVALWTYYRGAARDSGLDEGATTVALLPRKGWFWYIPLPDDVVSVGIVADPDYLSCDGQDRAVFFQREVEKNAWIREHLARGEQFGIFYGTGELSYRSLHCAADGLVLAGDAFGFLDPVFSSGVFLALKSGELAGDAAHTALKKGDVSASQFREYGRRLCAGIEAMRKLVYAFYDHEFSFRELIAKYPSVRGDLTDCLIGHLARDFDGLFAAIGEIAGLPEPLPYGRPCMSVPGKVVVPAPALMA